MLGLTVGKAGFHRGCQYIQALHLETVSPEKNPLNFLPVIYMQGCWIFVNIVYSGFQTLMHIESMHMDLCCKVNIWDTSKYLGWVYPMSASNSQLLDRQTSLLPSEAIPPLSPCDLRTVCSLLLYRLYAPSLVLTPTLIPIR